MVNFTKAEINHILSHITGNTICEEGYSGWYSGNKSQFKARHKRVQEKLEAYLDELEEKGELKWK